MMLKRKHILYSSAAAALLCCLGVLSALAAADRRMRTCEGVRISFSDERNFLNESDIKDYIDTQYGTYIGQRLDSIKLYRIEEILRTRSSIKNSEAWTTDDGYLNIRISRRKPVVRFQNGKDGFYADETGVFFPLKDGYSADVPIIDGDIPTDGEWIQGVLAMLQFMAKDNGWADKIVQIHVADNGDIIMIPREGRERFIFGGPRHFEDKFRRMGNYYRYIKSSEGGGNYVSVNLKYEGQIICK